MSDFRPTVPAVEELSDLELRILAFEHRRWLHAGAREQAIHDEFDGMSVTRYQQLLNAVLDKPEALIHDPVTINRLRRLRTTRRRARAG